MNIYTAASDASTNDVIDWVYFLSPHHKINRFNDYTIPQQFSIHIANGSLASPKSWYRRGSIFKPCIKWQTESKELDLIRKTYDTENEFIYEAYLDTVFDPLSAINAAKDNDTNKLINLRRAIAKGLDVPDTLVSNELAAIDNFLRDEQDYIIKDVAQDPIHMERGGTRFLIGLMPLKLTGKAIRERLQNNTSTYGFLFIQQYIEKRVELRIFYLKGICYSMAIFSQNNPKTQTDYRNYDKENPNRCIPFKLPENVAHKLHAFMNSAGINCGSIDMIYTPERRFVFLELNPIGQFQWLARNCNYDIERAIAKFLLT